MFSLFSLGYSERSFSVVLSVHWVSLLHILLFSLPANFTFFSILKFPFGSSLFCVSFLGFVIFHLFHARL